MTSTNDFDGTLGIGWGRLLSILGLAFGEIRFAGQVVWQGRSCELAPHRIERTALTITLAILPDLA